MLIAAMSEMQHEPDIRHSREKVQLRLIHPKTPGLIVNENTGITGS
jgi:hypothetical protein